MTPDPMEALIAKSRERQRDACFAFERQIYGWCADELEALSAIRTADRRAREADWQPIETYPADGGEVLLYGLRRFSVGIATGVWNRGDNMVMPHWMGEIRSPTHWQPLPAPPERQEP